MIRIAVIGCGRIARSHLRAIAELSDHCSLTAVVDVDRQRAADYAREYGCKHVFTDIAEAAVSDEFDAAIICLPHHLLAGAAQTMLAHRKHVLLEKPCGINAAEYRQAMETATKNGAILLPAYVCRFMDNQNALLEIVQSGKLGELQGIYFMINSAPLEKVNTPWWAKADLAGGFWLTIFGSHRIDEIFALTNRLPRTVYAAHQSNCTDVVEGETDGIITMRFDRGLLGMLTFAKCTVPALPFGGKMLIGSRGVLQVMDGKVNLNGKEMACPPPGQPFEKQLLHFCRVVAGEKPSVITDVTGYNVLQAIDATHLSNRTNSPVELA